MRGRTCLNDGWTVQVIGSSVSIPSQLSDPIPAEVPGCVHKDLIAANIIQHPDITDGEDAQKWVGRTSFRWRRVITKDELSAHSGDGRYTSLIFNSLDTVAAIRVDGVELLSVRNQFHPHKVDLKNGGRDILLEVDIAAPVDELERLTEIYGDRPVNADGEWGVYSYLRKAACSFGWDWGPQCPGSGITGKVFLESHNGCFIDAVRPYITCNEEHAQIAIRIDVGVESGIDSAACNARARLLAPDGRTFEGSGVYQKNSGGVEIHLEVDSPQRWWPKGFGEQYLHNLEVELSVDGSVVDHARRTIGIRSIELDQSEDADGKGTGFGLRINGTPIFCCGANWIPDGLFPGTADPDSIVTRITQAVDANMNMLRVWGGGVYEDSIFYDTCDKLGILVWQDCMFACATYPEDDPFPKLIEKEVRYQVSRLSHHASIVIWSGGNENVLAWRNWGWKERMPEEQAWGRSYFTELLPSIFAKLDSSRPFLPDSPWSGSIEMDPNDPDVGDRHTWDLKLENIRKMVPRFVSEFGHQSPPMRTTIEEACGIEYFASESPAALEAFAGRQRGWGGDAAQYDEFLESRFPEAVSLDQRLLQMHLAQAQATSISYEWLRANGERCRGALIWQLNDAWTGHSWSLIDAAGRVKPAWWAARASCAPRIITFQPFSNGLVCCAINDTPEVWSSEIVISQRKSNGERCGNHCEPLLVSPGGRTYFQLSKDVFSLDNDLGNFMLAEAEDVRATWFGQQSRYESGSIPSPCLKAKVVASRGGTALVLTAECVLRDLILDPSRWSPLGSVDRNVITLLPSESVEVACTGLDQLTVDTLQARGGVSAWGRVLVPAYVRDGEIAFSM